jgi:hypothetical protein
MFEEYLFDEFLIFYSCLFDPRYSRVRESSALFYQDFLVKFDALLVSWLSPAADSENNRCEKWAALKEYFYDCENDPFRKNDQFEKLVSLADAISSKPFSQQTEKYYTFKFAAMEFLNELRMWVEMDDFAAAKTSPFTKVFEKMVSQYAAYCQVPGAELPMLDFLKNKAASAIQENCRAPEVQTVQFPAVANAARQQQTGTCGAMPIVNLNSAYISPALFARMASSPALTSEESPVLSPSSFESAKIESRIFEDVTTQAAQGYIKDKVSVVGFFQGLYVKYPPFYHQLINQIFEDFQKTEIYQRLPDVVSPGIVPQ